MSQTEFSEPLKVILKSSGWHPGRSVDITDATKIIESRGHELHDAAARFLKEFQGLMLVGENHAWINCGMSRLSGGFGAGHMKELEQITSERWLCPVGEGEMTNLYLSPDGAMYQAAIDRVGIVRCENVSDTFELLLRHCKIPYKVWWLDDDGYVTKIEELNKPQKEEPSS